jgi:hypothetical protein
MINDQIEMQFKDAHSMLRLPVPQSALEAGCNFAGANCLLSLISGLSSLLTPAFDTSRISGRKFGEVMKTYYPWDIQPTVGDTAPHGIDGTITHLYQYFRNPLAHSLGIKTKGNYLVRIEKGPLSESDIEQLENNTSSPGPAISYSPITISGENIEKIGLNVPYLYWGVREMLHRMTQDGRLMRSVESNLQNAGY